MVSFLLFENNLQRMGFYNVQEQLTVVASRASSTFITTAIGRIYYFNSFANRLRYEFMEGWLNEIPSPQ
jgi:hypothetical protein